MVTTFTSIAHNVGANRIVFGGDFTSPIGDPQLPLDREKDYRKRVLEKCIDVLSTDIDSSTIFVVDEDKEAN